VNDAAPDSPTPGFRSPLFWIFMWGIALRAPYALHEMYDLDEGCYAAVAAAIVDGGTEYRDATDLKFPGIYWTYAAVFALFGNYQMHAVHGLTLLFVVATAWVIYRFARTAAGETAGCWGAFLYLSLTTLFPANLAANCELFMNLPYALSAWAIWRSGAAERGASGAAWALAAGTAAAAAMIYKQIGAVAAIVGGLHLLVLGHLHAISVRRMAASIGAFCAGFALLAGAMVAYLHFRGCYDDFVFWTLTYLAKYLSFSSARMSYLAGMATCFLPFCLIYGAAWLPAIGWFRARTVPLMLAVVTRAIPGDPYALVPLAGSWLVLSVAATLAGSRMYPHYWLQHLPPLALVAGIAIAGWRAGEATTRRRRLVVGWTVGWSLFSWAWAWMYVGETPPALVTPKPDYREAVDYVRRTTDPKARAFVWGWFTPLYVHTRLTPGTRFVNTQMFVTYKPEHKARDKQVWVTNAAQTWVEVPEAWEMLEEDFAQRPPELILDTSPGNHHRFGLFPMRDYPRLWKIVEEKYMYETTVGGVGVYRRRGNVE
jgi:hypothetical protein